MQCLHTWQPCVWRTVFLFAVCARAHRLWLCLPWRLLRGSCVCSHGIALPDHGACTFLGVVFAGVTCFLVMLTYSWINSEPKIIFGARIWTVKLPGLSRPCVMLGITWGDDYLTPPLHFSLSLPSSFLPLLSSPLFCHARDQTSRQLLYHWATHQEALPGETNQKYVCNHVLTEKLRCCHLLF